MNQTASRTRVTAPAAGRAPTPRPTLLRFTRTMVEKKGVIEDADIAVREAGYGG
jgi:hypothetical protein